MYELPAMLPTKQFCEPVFYERIILTGEMAPVLQHLFCNLNSFPCRQWKVYVIGEEHPVKAQRFMALVTQGIIKKVYGGHAHPWISAFGSDVL